MPFSRLSAAQQWWREQARLAPPPVCAPNATQPHDAPAGEPGAPKSRFSRRWRDWAFAWTFNRILTAMILGLLASSFFIVKIKLRERADEIEAATRYAHQVASILSEEISQSALAVDLTLDFIINKAVDRTTSETLLATAMQKETYESLVAALSKLPQSDVITITDAKGQMIASTRGYPHPDVDLSDRDYFRFFQSGGDGLFVSAPVHNKVTKAWTVYFVRAIRSGDGAFLGMALIGVQPGIFIQARQALVALKGQSFGLFRSDGVILLRQDDEKDHTGETIPASSQWHELARKEGGTYRSPGYFDGVPRHVAVAPVRGYPLVIDVAMDEEHILANWRSRSLRALRYFAVAVALMAALLAALRREHFKVSERETEVRRALRQASDASAKLEHQALHDSLTGLNNRAAFVKRLEEIKDAGKPDRWALLLLDLDGFKLVNDSFGHDVGDELLRETAARLLVAVPGQFVGRLGGDEFVLLHPAIDDDQVADLAGRLLQAVSAPYLLDGKRLTVEVSIGIKIFDSSACDFRRIMRRADLALNEAKRQGRNCFRTFDGKMDATFQMRVALAADLRGALLRDELQVYYQPIVHAGTREVIKREALLRWFHPVNGSVPPDLFIQLAEEMGMIVSLGEWVLRRACMDAQSWEDQAQVSVNVSPLQIAQGDFEQFVGRALADANLPSRRLQLEITESVFLQANEKNISKLHALKTSGVDIALDDFGTGYASLSYMKSFPFSSIKIDRSFISGLSSDSSSMAIVAATTGLARALNLSTTAEGVETEEQYEILRAAGVDNMQGYLFGRPSPMPSGTAATGAGLSEQAA